MATLQHTKANLLLIQEPLWFRLVPQRSDTNPEGVATFGTTRLLAWHVIHPVLRDRETPKVLIFLHVDLTALPYSSIPSFSSACTLGISSQLAPDREVHVLNFYHQVVEGRP
jgi:hypothetical protein